MGPINGCVTWPTMSVLDPADSACLERCQSALLSPPRWLAPIGAACESLLALLCGVGLQTRLANCVDCRPCRKRTSRSLQHSDWQHHVHRSFRSWCQTESSRVTCCLLCTPRSCPASTAGSCSRTARAMTSSCSATWFCQPSAASFCSVSHSLTRSCTSACFAAFGVEPWR